MVPGRGQPNLARPGEAGHRDAPGHEHEGGVAGVPGGRPGRAGQPQSHGGDGAGGNVSAGQEGKAAHRPDTDGADDPECRADAQRGCQRQRRHYPARDGAGRGVDAAASTRKPQQHQRADQAERRPAEQAEAVGALACEGEREGAAVAGGDAEGELAGVDTLGGLGQVPISSLEYVTAFGGITPRIIFRQGRKQAIPKPATSSTATRAEGTQINIACPSMGLGVTNPGLLQAELLTT